MNFEATHAEQVRELQQHFEAATFDGYAGCQYPGVCSPWQAAVQRLEAPATFLDVWLLEVPS